MSRRRRGKVYKRVGTRTYYGPFDGSKENHGRRIFTWYDSATGKTGSVNAARLEYETRTGRHLSRDEQVDHKDSDNRHDSASNEQVLSKHDNVAKENKRRAHHKRRRRERKQD